MSLQNINRGTSANDGTGTPAREAGKRINENFAFLYNGASDFKTVIGPVLPGTGSGVSAEAAAEINASTPFTFNFAQLGFIKYVEFDNGDINDIFFFKLVRVAGSKTFGNTASAFELTNLNLFLTGQKLKSVQDFEELNTTVTEDFGDIGTTTLKDYVNGLTPAVSLQATSVGATILKAIVNSEPVSFLFKGDAGDYGAGALQLMANDLESLNETTNVSIPIDTILSLTSSNPVENRVVKAALDALQNQIDNGGADGNGIESVDDNGDGTLTFNFTDGSTYTTPNLIGPQGTPGANGSSAYQVWLNLGNSGTEQDFIDSLQGVDGVIGSDGDSAYQVWLNQGNTGTKQDFIDSLQGPAGQDGAPGQDGQDGVAIGVGYDTLVSPANEIDMTSPNHVIYNQNNPTDQIVFTLTNMQAGRTRQIEVSNNTNGAPETVTINGTQNELLNETLNDWNDFKTMIIHIHCFAANNYEWWFYTKLK